MAQKLKPVTAIPEDLVPVECTLQEGRIVILWNDKHSSSYTADFLRCHDYSNGMAPTRIAPPASRDWTGAEIAKRLGRYSYGTLMSSEADRLDFYTNLLADGIALVEHVDPSQFEQAIRQLGAFSRETFYGTYYTVDPLRNEEDIAFTDLPIGPHTDYSVLQTNPEYAFLYGSQVSASDIATYFINLECVLRDYERDDPENYQHLLELEMAHEQRRDDAKSYYVSRHNIVTRGGGLSLLKHGYMHMAPLDLPFDEMERAYSVYRDFFSRMERPEYRFDHIIGQGDMVVWDNRRVVHGRDSVFGTNTKSRIITGGTFTEEDLLSKYRYFHVRVPKSH